MNIPKLNEMSFAVQLLVIAMIGAGIWAASQYVVLKGVINDNSAKQARVASLTRDIEPLRPYREKLRLLEAENTQLETQLDNLQHIVPSDKEVDNFVRLVESQAVGTGVSVRRFTARDFVQRQFYVEVPFEVELDGRFYDIMQFYDRLGKLERIINVSDLRMGELQPGKAGGKYEYAPNESVVVTCTVTTFFSSEGASVPPAPAPAAGAHATAPPAGSAAAPGK